MSAEMFVGIFATTIFFILSSIMSFIVVIYVRTRTPEWQPPPTETSSCRIDNSPPFCSARAVRDRYLKRLSVYTIPRVFFTSGVLTTAYAYNVTKILPQDAVSFLVTFFIIMFVVYIISPERAHYY